VLVRNGSLRVGDALLCGPYHGRAKALITSRDERVRLAGPSTPVKVLGLSGTPEAGSVLEIAASERDARARASEREEELRRGELAVQRHASLEDLFRQIEEEARAELKLVIKSDVQGSLEAISDSIAKIQSDKVRVTEIHSGVGEITENDVTLAAASDAIVLGFHVRAMPGVSRLAKQHGVEVRLYSVIYELLEELREAMRGQLAPEYRESALGEAEIIQVFETSTSGKICGCRVNGGLMRVGASVRVSRGEDTIYNGQIQSLRRFKDDVREVRSGLECGIRLDNFEDFEEGDIIEAYSVVEVAAEL
jgi:translation initiation factor IF-2